VTLKDKIHTYLWKKALDEAIFELVGPWGEYYIDDEETDIYFKFKNNKIIELENLQFNLPSLDEIKKLAKKKYRKFDGSIINKIVYGFEFSKYTLKPSVIDWERNLTLIAKDSDIDIYYSIFNNINIQSTGKVKMFDTSSNSNINIDAKTVEINGCSRLSRGDTNINAEYVEFNNVHMVKNLNINSQLISLNNLSMTYSDNIILNADMIDCKNSELKAQNKIEITNTNCDEIKGIYAPVIIYNGQDITYSQDIVVPKLRKNLIEDLYKVRNEVSGVLNNELEEKTQKIKQELNNKPITKILKK